MNVTESELLPVGPTPSSHFASLRTNLKMKCQLFSEYLIDLPISTHSSLDLTSYRETFYDQSTSLRLYSGEGLNFTSCQKSYAGLFDFNAIDVGKVLCFESSSVLQVPCSCDIPVGTPIYTKVKFNGKSMILLRGLAIFSIDCGPVIATNISAYVDWINDEAFNKPYVT